PASGFGKQKRPQILNRQFSRCARRKIKTLTRNRGNIGKAPCLILERGKSHVAEAAKSVLPKGAQPGWLPRCALLDLAKRFEITAQSRNFSNCTQAFLPLSCASQGCVHPSITFALELQRQFRPTGLHDSAAGENVNVIRNDVVQQPLVVS